MKVLEWFAINNPFDGEDIWLRCILSGMIIADVDDIKCDLAEETGEAIMTKMDEIAVSDVVLKRKDQVRTLLEIEKEMTVAGKSVNFHSSISFDRLLLIVERSPDMEVNRNV